MLKMNDANDFRRTLAGLCLIAAPLAFGGSDVIRLSIEGGAAEGREQLAAIAASPGLWQVAGFLNMVGVILFVPAILGLMHLMRKRSVVLGHIGGALALIGMLGWAAHNRGYFGFMGAAGTSEIGHGQMVGFIEHWATSPDTIYYVLMFLVGSLFGMLLLGIGLYRARVTYRWAAALFLGGTVLYNVTVFTPAAENMLAIGVFHAIIALGLAGTGVNVLAMSDEDWERMHAAAPAAEAAPIGTRPRVQ
ncbi:MAG: hypothetical protein H0U65_02680 [Rubrobacter sp.]|nr:hypothetical protein [Rubrobacter sp.]